MAPRDNEYSEIQAAKVYYLKNTDDPKVSAVQHIHIYYDCIHAHI
jgi:hypothetical protein